MKYNAWRLVSVALIASVKFLHGGELPPNRGAQLSVLIAHRELGTQIIAMKPQRWVIRTWNPRLGTYDFVRALVRRTHQGSNTSFTRYVMKEDYLPRIQHLELAFPYASQPRYRFFDGGSIVGFYRNSVDDFDALEFLWPGHKHASQSRS